MKYQEITLQNLNEVLSIESIEREAKFKKVQEFAKEHAEELRRRMKDRLKDKEDQKYEKDEEASN